MISVIFVSLLFLRGMAHAVDMRCRNEDSKCTDDDPREIYHKCSMYSVTWALYCGQSRFEKVPDPDTILPYMSCKNATALYIEDSCLRTIKRDDLKKYTDITTFLGGRNFLKELPDKLFSENKKLTRIDFCGNQITEIDPTAFSGLSWLKFLNLGGNELTHIPDYIFRGLNSLNELSLHDNKIAVLHSGVFRGLRNLRILRLTANRIGFIDRRAFDGMRRLTHLHLDENRMTAVNCDLFVKTPTLEVLTLSYNRIEDWSGGVCLKSVHTLDLAFNLISKFESNHVTNMTKLQNLSIENNSLTSLSDDVFLSTPDLSYLNVGGNRLKSIGTNTFSHLCHLETLVLRDNALKTPRSQWLIRIVENNVTQGNNVSMNEWECNCDIIEYENFLEGLRKRKRSNENWPDWNDAFQITCNSPPRLKGRKLDQLLINLVRESGCESKNTTLNEALPCSQISTQPFRRIPSTYRYTPTATTRSTPTSGLQRSKNTENLTTVVVTLPRQKKFTREGMVTVVIYAALFVAIVVLISILIQRRILKLKLCLRKGQAGRRDEVHLIAPATLNQQSGNAPNLPTPNNAGQACFFRDRQETRPKVLGDDGAQSDHEYEEMRLV